MRREIVKATAWGVLTTGVLAFLIWIGSRNLSHFDAALVAYTFAVLFATFGITYRYAMWLQRPPTRMYWRRGWQVFFMSRYRFFNIRNWFRSVTEVIVLNGFIWKRDKLRGLTHSLIMWGCFLAVAITFPLVFGWLHFESVPGSMEWYRVFVFGFPTFTFPVHSVFGFLLFHGLVWASFLVITGVMLAMRRRMREEGATALQMFVEDFLPLILLFAVSVTGLMLTASYTWMKGTAYDFLAILHAITVIFTFLWLPFGKLFHIFQRPAQIGARFYKDVGEKEEPARCRRCDTPFTSRMHVEDLIIVEKELGYNYELIGAAGDHYQWICPPCRRAMVALAQGSLWEKHARTQREITPGKLLSTPSYANPATGQGPLGTEDSRNFHP